MRRTKKPVTHTATVNGKVIKSPQRIKTRTGKIMASLMLQAESDTRSPYPVQVVAFDEDALELMLHQRGQSMTVTGRAQWQGNKSQGGYQLVVKAFG